MSAVAKFSAWLEATPLSQTLQTHEWVIPAVQTIHIVSIALVMSSAVMLGFRVFGWIAAREAASDVARRFLPVIWWCLPVLLVTGGTLIIAEPGRSLANPVFLVKMLLLLCAIALTVVYQRGLRSDVTFWDRSPTRRRIAIVGAAVALAIWTGIVFAGRWIAYVQAF
jgi:hypothetical protein